MESKARVFSWLNLGARFFWWVSQHQIHSKKAEKLVHVNGVVVNKWWKLEIGEGWVLFGGANDGKINELKYWVS